MALHFLPRHAPQTGLRLSRRFSTSRRNASYADTLPNVKIGAHTRVLFQGFTGSLSWASFITYVVWLTSAQDDRRLPMSRSRWNGAPRL
jgi:succinyl-CoA synthetase alpha subunit